MKALSFSKLVCALALGVMVFWAAAAPVATGADSLLIGGEWRVGGAGCPCNDETEMWCSDGPPETKGYCNPAYETWVCVRTGSSSEKCDPQGYDQCDYGAQYSCPGEETKCE